MKLWARKQEYRSVYGDDDGNIKVDGPDSGVKVAGLERGCREECWMRVWRSFEPS